MKEMCGLNNLNE